MERSPNRWGSAQVANEGVETDYKLHNATQTLCPQLPKLDTNVQMQIRIKMLFR